MSDDIKDTLRAEISAARSGEGASGGEGAGASPATSAGISSGAPVESRPVAEDSTAAEVASGRGDANVSRGEGRARDSAGKFVKGETTKTEAPKAATKDATPAPALGATPSLVKPPVAGETTPAAPKFKPPPHWTPTAREKWATLPEEIQAEVDRVERDTKRAMQEAARPKEFHQQFSQAVAPYAAMIQAAGGDPVKYTQTLYQTAYTLQSGTPAQKQQTWFALADSFGIPVDAGAVAKLVHSGRITVEQLAQALNGQPAQQAQESVDPRVLATQVREQVWKDIQAQQEERQRVEMARQLEEFKESHEFFDDCRKLMAALIESGDATDWESAYNAALTWHKANPKSKVGDVLRQREEKQNRETAQAATQRAINASSSVKSQPAVMNGASGDGTLKDDLRQAFAEARRR